MWGKDITKFCYGTVCFCYLLYVQNGWNKQINSTDPKINRGFWVLLLIKSNFSITVLLSHVICIKSFHFSCFPNIKKLTNSFDVSTKFSPWSLQSFLQALHFFTNVYKVASSLVSNNNSEPLFPILHGIDNFNFFKRKSHFSSCPTKPKIPTLKITSIHQIQRPKPQNFQTPNTYFSPKNTHCKKKIETQKTPKFSKP